MVKYFVSPTGNNANSGLTVALAKATLKAATDLLANGDEIEVLPGTYPNQPTPQIIGKNNFKIYGSYGDASTPKPTLVFNPDVNGAYNGLDIRQCNSFTISNLRLHGVANTYDPAVAIAFQNANPGTFSAKYDMNGTSIQDCYNFILRDLIVQDFPGGGLGGTDCDLAQCDHCTVRRCTSYSKYGNQAFSFLHGKNSPGAVAGRTSLRFTNCSAYDNINQVEWKTEVGGNGRINEGSAFYFDSTKRASTDPAGATTFTGKGLVDSCIASGNGAAGFQALNSTENTIRNSFFGANRRNVDTLLGEIQVNNTVTIATNNYITTKADRAAATYFGTSNASTSSFSNSTVVGTTTISGSAVTKANNTFI